MLTKMRHPYLYLVIFLFLSGTLAGKAGAQEFLVQGAVMSKSSGLRISTVKVYNLRNKQVALTNELGIFKIRAMAGDTLKISKDSFNDFAAVITSQADLVIQLRPNIELNEATVKGQTKKQEMEDALNDYRKKGTFYNGKPPLLSYLFTPLTALYELLGKTPAHARRFNNYYHHELEENEIDQKFSMSLVKENTGLETDELTRFMHDYRPLYNQVSGWNDYDMISYIKRSLVKFKEAAATVKN